MTVTKVSDIDISVPKNRCDIWPALFQLPLQWETCAHLIPLCGCRLVVLVVVIVVAMGRVGGDGGGGGVAAGGSGVVLLLYISLYCIHACRYIYNT